MKKVLVAVLVVVIALVAVFVLRTGTETYEAPTSPSTDATISPSTSELPVNNNPDATPITEEPVIEEGETGAITAGIVAAHASKDDCWVVFEGKVYDLTSWIPKHPGGEQKIIPTCGSMTKFEEDFLRKHKRGKVSLLMDVGTFIGDFDVVGTISK